MPNCMVSGCGSGRGKVRGVKGKETVQLFRFPENVFIRNRWIRQLHFDPKYWQPTGQRICNLHFSIDCFVPPNLNVDKRGRRRNTLKLKPEAVPTKLRDFKERLKLECKFSNFASV